MKIRDVVLWLILIPILLIWVAILVEVYVPAIDIPGIEAPGSNTPTAESEITPTEGLTDTTDAQESTEVDFSSLPNVLSFLTDAKQNIPIAFSSETKPYSSLEGSSADGFEIDLVKEVETRWFKNSDRQFELIPIGADDRIAAAQSGKYGFVVGAVSQNISRCSQADDR